MVYYYYVFQNKNLCEQLKKVYTCVAFRESVSNIIHKIILRNNYWCVIKNTCIMSYYNNSNPNLKNLF